MTYTIEQIRAALAGNTAASGGLIGYRIALMDCLAHIDAQEARHVEELAAYQLTVDNLRQARGEPAKGLDNPSWRHERIDRLMRLTLGDDSYADFVDSLNKVAAAESTLTKIRADVLAAGLANGGIESAADVVPEILSQIGAKVEAATLAERERAARVCDELCDDQWAKYKGLPPHVGHPARGNTYTEGVSDGAGMCADKIRSGEI